MAEKRLGQGSFVDASLGHGVGRNARLERIAEHFRWERFEGLLRPLRASHGRPGYPALALFKALLLQQWCNTAAPLR